MIYNLIQHYQPWLIEHGLYKYLQVFNQITFRAIAALILAFIIVILNGRRVILWLIKQKIGDNPEFNHADLNKLTRGKENTPTMGGILIVFAIFASTLLLGNIFNFYIQMGLLCLVCFGILGALDDWLKLTTAKRTPGSRQGLYSWEKLLFQIAFALTFGFFIHHHGEVGQIKQTSLLMLPFQRTIDPQTKQLAEGLIFLSPWLFGALTVFVIAGSSNAVNLTDGMDGLVSGIMAIVCFAFMVLCWIIGQEKWSQVLLMPSIPQSDELSIMAGAMVGACVGFLWFNCHPAQVFMGDTGSLSMGALLGYITVVIRQELMLVVIGGILVVEALSVMLQVGYFKATKGKRIFKCAPIHHHFHLSGWTEQQVVVRFWLISALLAAIALATVKLR